MQCNGLYAEQKQQQFLCDLKLILALGNLRMFQTLYEYQREHKAQIAVKILYLCTAIGRTKCTWTGKSDNIPNID